MIPAARGVLRCSGNHLFDDIRRWFSKYAFGYELTESRSIQHFECELFSGLKTKVTAFVFCAPHSATGENVIEFHLPGNPVLLQRLQQSLSEFDFQAAQPGEFTRRAFINGKLDLSQAEAVLDLVQSRSIESARAATQILSGALSQQMTLVRNELMASLVELEAGLDFEEGDSQDLKPAEVITHVENAKNILASASSAQQQRSVNSNARFTCLLVGPPNAGKSTLFKQLTNTPSLVSSEAGTTRDYRRAEWLNMQGDIDADVIDFPGTGGLAVDQRDAAARELLEDFNQFDMALLCLHPLTTPESLPQRIPNVPLLVVFTHADLRLQPCPELTACLRERFGDYPCVSIAAECSPAATSASLENAIQPFFDDAEKVIAQRIRNSERYQLALENASAAVAAAIEWLDSGGQQDLVAAELHHALAILAELVGEMTPDDLLDRLFSAFCVGK